ncbi:MAG: shikimate kinase [Candidatus Bathycorpusculaceae bacterium]
MIGKAIAYGAVTIVNAIACGFGAALGVKLWTKATVKLTSNPRKIEGKIISDPDENQNLIVETVKQVLSYFNLENLYGAYAKTESNIPVAKGLKSSSAAANAIALATLSALNKEIDNLTVVKLGVQAAVNAKVTITGAFDDACASYFGNIVVTDNKAMKIMKMSEAKGDYAVLIHVPPEKRYTASIDVKETKTIAREIKAIHKLALNGDYWTAMTLNGLAYSAVFGYSPRIVLEALMNGAVAAGLSGTGPAVAAIVPKENIDGVAEAWRKHRGTVIKTEINREKAHVLR